MRIFDIMSLNPLACSHCKSTLAQHYMKKEQLSISLLRSAIACLHGACSSQGQPALCNVIDLTCSEGWVPNFPDLTCY